MKYCSSQQYMMFFCFCLAWLVAAWPTYHPALHHSVSPHPHCLLPLLAITPFHHSSSLLTSTPYYPTQPQHLLLPNPSLLQLNLTQHNLTPLLATTILPYCSLLLQPTPYFTLLLQQRQPHQHNLSSSICITILEPKTGGARDEWGQCRLDVSSGEEWGRGSGSKWE